MVEEHTASTEHGFSQYYYVYTPEFYGTPNHIGVFVETEEDGPKMGRMFEVTGNVVIRGGGMQYEDTKSDRDRSVVQNVKDHLHQCVLVARQRQYLIHHSRPIWPEASHHE